MLFIAEDTQCHSILQKSSLPSSSALDVNGLVNGIWRAIDAGAAVAGDPLQGTELRAHRQTHRWLMRGLGVMSDQMDTDSQATNALSLPVRMGVGERAGENTGGWREGV